MTPPLLLSFGITLFLASYCCGITLTGPLEQSFSKGKLMVNDINCGLITVVIDDRTVFISDGETLSFPNHVSITLRSASSCDDAYLAVASHVEVKASSSSAPPMTTSVATTSPMTTSVATTSPSDSSLAPTATATPNPSVEDSTTPSLTIPVNTAAVAAAFETFKAEYDKTYASTSAEQQAFANFQVHNHVICVLVEC